MDEQSYSPTPNIKTPMSVKKIGGIDFPAAMQAIKDGKKIHKLEWDVQEFYGFLNENILSLHKPDGKNYQWIINDGDVMGEDYIIL